MTTPLIGALWALTLMAIHTDYRNASGLFDCWPSCTAFQRAVRFGFFLPIAFVVAATLVGIFVAITRPSEPLDHSHTHDR